MKDAIRILIHDCGSIPAAKRYAERIARSNGPLASEYAGYAQELGAMPYVARNVVSDDGMDTFSGAWRFNPSAQNISPVA